MKKIFLVGMLVGLLALGGTGCMKRKDTSAGRRVIQDIESARNISDPEDRASRLAKLAVQQNELLKDSLGARTTIQLAEKACGEIEDIRSKVTAYSTLSESYLQLGRSSGARQALKKAQAAIGELPENTPADEMIESLLGLANAQGALGATADASLSLQGVMEQLDKIESEIGKVDTVTKVAAAYTQMKAEAGRDEMYAKLTEMAEAAENARTRCDIYCRLADIQLKGDLKEIGETTLKTALDGVEKIEGLGAQAMTLCQIATVYQGTGNDAEARKLVQDADKRANREKDNSLRTAAQEQVSSMKSKLGL
ncbi:MAG: hypothetical protein Q4D62_12985 [Planctomycetia bacterium]|nr:hypothetical protein [Planctomycetia bacterium]